jgi:hypothetical protein
MKSLLGLMKSVLTDVGTWCGVDTALDYKYIESRTNYEGLPFLAVRLATFAKDLERVLRDGCVADDSFAGFRRRAGLPVFLRGFLQRIVGPDGVLLLEPDPDCIFAIRQICLLCEKVRIDYSEAVKAQGFRSYLESEVNVKDLDRHLSNWDPEDNSLELLKKLFVLLWGDVLSSTESSLLSGEIIPRHGPGKTADRLSGNQKWRQATWPVRLDEWFPHQEYLVPNLRYWREATEHVTFLSPRTEIPVRVVTVPKTVKKARIIAIEPTAIQYCQQALDREIRKNLDRYRLGFVSLNDQSPNQEAARLGSLSGELATLDISAASDSLSNQLLLELMGPWGQLSAAIQACRSTKADVLGETIRLSKFASMGSALCFPIETMVFVTLAVAGTLADIKHKGWNTITKRDVESCLGKVRSYGDDIIVPSERAPMVISWLEAFGFKVNVDKSFWTGKFRESCGREYYDGVDVSIVRLREHIATSPRSAGVVSTVSLRNLLYFRGLWHTARWLDGLLGRGLRHYPTVHDTSAILGRHTLLDYEVQWVSADTQSPMVKGYTTKVATYDDPLDGVWALSKALIKSEEVDDPFSFIDSPRLGVKHLELSERSSVVNTKLTGAPPF